MTTPEQMADLLRQAIREKVIPPGGLLVQEDLARRFKVSRNPVREALRMLSSEGLVTMAPGERASVRSLTVADLQEIYDLRIALEPPLSGWIVDEARPKDVAELRSMATQMAATDDLMGWLRQNYTFHLRLYAMAGRPHTEGMVTNLLALTQPYSQENVGNLGGRPSADDEHMAMVEAIESRDAERLAEVVRSHLVAARDRVAAAMAETVGRTGDGMIGVLVD